jgi:cytidine deaminase
MRAVLFDQLSCDNKELLSIAKFVLDRSYNPYSGFHVGAALRGSNGQIYSGTNFENASYGNTLCAERSALASANNDAQREFSSIAIIARAGENPTTQITAPCGTCRQSLFEASQIADSDLEVIMSTTNFDKIIVSSIQELLPLGFGPKDLGIDVTKYG